MHTSKAARRYASALLDIAKEQDKVESILEDVTFIHNTLEGSRDLVLFLKSPIIKFDDKTEALESIFSKKLGDITNRFIKLLARKNRVNLLDQITEAFIEAYKKYAGIITIEIFVARELNESQKDALHESLEELTQKSVDMNINIDESLKGGMAVRIDDTVIDGTVKHKLEMLEQSFMSTVVE